MYTHPPFALAFGRDPPPVRGLFRPRRLKLFCLMLLWAYNAGIVCFLAYAVSEEVCRLKANGWAFRTTAHRAAPHLSLCDLVALFTGWGALLWIRCIVPTQLRVAMLQCLCSRQRCVVSSAEFGGNALPCSTSTGAWGGGGALNIYSCFTLQSECRTWNGNGRLVSHLALRRRLRGEGAFDIL